MDSLKAEDLVVGMLLTPRKYVMVRGRRKRNGTKLLVVSVEPSSSYERYVEIAFVDLEDGDSWRHACRKDASISATHELLHRP